VFDANGTFVRTFGGSGSELGLLNEPVGLAMDGDTLLVADAWNGRIQRLDRDGSPVGSIPIQGWEGRGVANKPYIAVGPGSTIYITLPERGEVQQVSPDGRVTPLPRPADRANRLGFPTGITVGPDGVVYTAEAQGGTIVLTRAGGTP
jgi:DNA-binding beta-propeller fold protein YncE